MKTLKIFGIALLLTILASCGVRPPEPNRIYENEAWKNPEAGIELYDLTESVFRGEGFEILDRDDRGGYIETEWMEYEGDEHGLLGKKWNERRKYVVIFTFDIINRFYRLHLYLDVEEEIPFPKEWQVKEIEKSSDPGFHRLLKKIDKEVIEHGGRIIK